MKTEFPLYDGMSIKIGTLNIVGESPRHIPYVTMQIKGVEGTNVFLPQAHLELIAVNILKALKSKKLK